MHYALDIKSDTRNNAKSHTGQKEAPGQIGKRRKSRKLCEFCLFEKSLTRIQPEFLSDPGVPGPIYGSSCLSLTHRAFANLTDVTLADEDTKLCKLCKLCK